MRNNDVISPENRKHVAQIDALMMGMDPDVINEFLIHKLFQMINVMGNDRKITEELITYLKVEHRYVQQQFWSMIRKVAMEYKDFNYDERNEDAVKLAGYIDAFSEILENRRGRRGSL